MTDASGGESTMAKNMAVFIDADNLNDPTALDHVLTTLRSMAERVIYKRAYGRTESLKGLEAVFWRHGVRPVANLAVNKVTTDVALTIDAVEVVCTHKIDAIAICSGDADFVPLVTWLRERGCRVFCFSLDNKIFANPESFYDDVILLSVVQQVEPVSVSIDSLPLPLAPEVIKNFIELPPSLSPSAAVASPVVVPKFPVCNAASTDDSIVQRVLDAFPALRSGKPQYLSQVVAVLRECGILDKSIKTSEWFEPLASVFQLLPRLKPNKLVYLFRDSIVLEPAHSAKTEVTKNTLQRPLPQPKFIKPLVQALPDEVQHILKALPDLRSEPQMLSQVVPVLRAKGILGKTTKSTAFFVRHAAYFKLTPVQQPTQLEFLIPIRQGEPCLPPTGLSSSQSLDVALPDAFSAKAPATVFGVLAAAPEMRTGLLMDLGHLSNKLCREGVIATSDEGCAFLQKYPSSFRLLPPDNPNAVQYIA